MPHPPHFRPAYTLLEVAAAAAILAVALVPTLRLMRSGIEVSDQVAVRELLTTLCVNKLEAHLADAAYGWTAAGEAGSFAADGYADLRYDVTRSDAGGAGGIPGRLMVIEAIVWEETSGNAFPDAGEIQVSMRSKVARLAAYP